MAVNSYNPRLFSSSSSENDVDEVFRHKGGSVVAPVGGSLPTAKSRCFSEPIYQKGKEVVKEDSKLPGKTSALSDSSNVLTRQRGRLVMSNGSENPSGCGTKSESCATFEDAFAENVDRDKSVDNVFPEPESSREATKDVYRFSILLEEEEELMDDMIPNLGQELRDPGVVGEEFPDELHDEDARMDGMENDVFYMRDIAFGSTDGDAAIHTDDQQNEDYDDDSYPEKEQIPSGYISCAAQDLPYVSYPWEVPRAVLRSYSELPLGKVPELPDDLIKETGIYPEDLGKDFNDLSPVLAPSSFAPPDCELKMQFLFSDN